MPGRCAVCFCPADWHEHYTSPYDKRCGTCGPLSCPAYVDPAKKWPKLTPEQRRTREIALERIHLNTIALLPFVQSTRPPVQIPQQRRPPPRRQGGPIVDVAALKRRRPDGSPR